MSLRIIYSLFIGLLWATLIGVGIAAFYPGPKAPEYPAELSVARETPAPGGDGAALIEAQRSYDVEQKLYRRASERYSHDVSIAALVAAIASLVVSLTLFRRISLIADGLLLGGLFTLIYGIFRAFGDGDQVFRFIVISVGFVIAVTLGYLKFVRPEKKPKKRRKR